MKEQLKLFREDSLANHSHSLESGKERRMNAIYGTRCYEQYKRLNPSGSLRRMSMVLSTLTGDWYSTKCALIWKMKGTKCNRLLLRLVPKTLPIEETESGLLPTPSAMIIGDVDMDKLDARREKEKARGNNGNGFGKSLPELAKKGLLPTPTMFDYNSARTPEKYEEDKKKYAEKGVNLQLGLKQMARNGLLPTPKAQEARGNASRDRGKFNLTDEIAARYQPTSKSSQLNPRFVEEMMGFPVNWTLLPFQSGETNQ